MKGELALGDTSLDNPKKKKEKKNHLHAWLVRAGKVVRTTASTGRGSYIPLLGGGGGG